MGISPGRTVSFREGNECNDPFENASCQPTKTRTFDFFLASKVEVEALQWGSFAATISTTLVFSTSSCGKMFRKAWTWNKVKR